MPSLSEPLPAPPRLTRRRSDGTEGRLSRDRLITMVVLAALLHGLIILGVSFTTPASRGDGVEQGMEILLVSDELPEARENDTATYLAQRTQTGSGNTRERLAARLPAEEQPAPSAEAPPGQQAEAQTDPLLTTTNAASLTRVQMVALPEPTTSAETPEQSAEAQRASDEALRLRGEVRDELYVTADTRASRLAPYLDGWRRRVERIGTLNYPSVQRSGLTGNPVIEVALQRDGQLKSARILRSSGQAQIDAAALAILRLASPFDPFPPELGKDYASLRFAYEWQFEGGGRVPGVLTVP